MKLRYGSFGFILVALLGAFIWIRGFYGSSHQDKTIALILLSFLGGAVLLVWYLTMSGAPPKVRRAVLVGALLLVCGLAGTLKVKGVTGDLLPILGWRWGKSVVPDASAGNLSSAGSASVDLEGPSFPQFGGPERHGEVDVKSLPPLWYQTAPKLLWRQPVGAAWSGFAFAGQLAVTQEQVGEEEQVRAVDLTTGRTLWTHRDDAKYSTTIAGEGPRATPTLAAGKVFTLGATGILNCLDAVSGRLVWSVSLLSQFKTSLPEWGMSGSPLVHGAHVIVGLGGAGHSILAFDKATGKLAWTGGSSGGGYSSPVMGELQGVQVCLMFQGEGVLAHRLLSGELLWNYPWKGGHPHVTMPLIVSSNQVLVSSGYGTGSELIRVTKSPEGVWKAVREWKSMGLKSKFSNLLLDGDYIYGLDDGIMACLNLKTGKQLWKDGRFGHGQLVKLGNVIGIMAESGEWVVVDANPSELKILAKHKLLSGKTWNPPAIAGKYLLVRNDQEAACFELP